MAEPTYLGDLSACEPWAAVGMSCAACNVSWTGCWDNFQCPKCGEGELPGYDSHGFGTAQEQHKEGT